nr:hypothetical protein [Tanacetum cinerariifolium]
MGFEYKHDYTVIDSPRAVIFQDKYGVQMMMRFNEDESRFKYEVLDQEGRGSVQGVDCCPIANGSQSMSHVKPNRISPAKGDNKLPVDDQPRKNKSHLRTSNPDMTAPSGQATANIREASYYQEYLANVVKHRWFLAGEPARKSNPTA